MQNLATIRFTPERLAAIDAALDTLELHDDDFVLLTAQQRREATKMGTGSESFCRQALVLGAQSSKSLPVDTPVEDAAGDLQARETMLPRLYRITRLQQRYSDSCLALGSDVMAMALFIYRQFQLTGHDAGLEVLQRELGGRFARGKRKAAKAPAPKAETG